MDSTEDEEASGEKDGPVTCFEAVRACSIALLTGAVLHASDVTAGNGKVIDWREVRSGAELLADGDAFDVAHLFVTLVGEEAAHAAATRDMDIAPPPPDPEPEIEVYAYGPSPRGGRRRAFDAGPFRVIVEPDEEDDAAQAAFTAALARAAKSIERTS